jgi:hypothetical protein
MAGVNAASAEPMLRNVAGFDPGLLAGKTCQGTFDTGRRRPPAIRPWSEGGITAAFRSQWRDAHRSYVAKVWLACAGQAAYAITQPGATAFNTRRFEDLGEVRDLNVNGPVISYVDPQGARVALSYDRGWLRGQSNPIGGSNPNMTKVANLVMICL